MTNRTAEEINVRRLERSLNAIFASIHEDSQSHWESTPGLYSLMLVWLKLQQARKMDRLKKRARKGTP